MLDGRVLRGTLALAALAATSAAAAQDGPSAKALVAAALPIAAAIELGQNLVAACDRRDPGGAGPRAAALAAWRAAQPIEAFEEAFRAAAATVPDLDDARRRVAATARSDVGGLVAKQPALCRRPDIVFASASMTLDQSVRTFRALAARVAGSAASPAQPGAEPGAPARPPSAAKLHTLAQLGALLTTAMDGAVPRSEAETNRKRRDAREDVGLEAVKALGVIATRGRAVDDDEIREWRGDQQSTYDLRCRSFRDDADKERMKAAAGKDVLVAGTVASISEDRERPGGRISLRGCGVFPAESGGLQPASLPEEGGLMLRPPEDWEAFAGPGKGFDPGDVDRVVYAASFDIRWDGFGNTYTDRRESIYVLLDDGTAYLHRWKFPFTDLNVALSKRREPDRWFTWSAGWLSSKLVLKQTGGDEAGEETVIEKPELLKPFAAGATFDHRYYFLNVGMGGLRRDRAYAFRKDGTLTATRSSFVAANAGFGGGDVTVTGPGMAFSGGGAFGQGFIAAQGPSGETVARYAIDGWALTLTGPKGETERHFLARPEDEAGDPPDSAIIDGEVYWTRKKD